MKTKVFLFDPVVAQVWFGALERSIWPNRWRWKHICTALLSSNALFSRFSSLSRFSPPSELQPRSPRWEDAEGGRSRAYVKSTPVNGYVHVVEWFVARSATRRVW